MDTVNNMAYMLSIGFIQYSNNIFIRLVNTQQWDHIQQQGISLICKGLQSSPISETIKQYAQTNDILSNNNAYGKKIGLNTKNNKTIDR